MLDAITLKNLHILENSNGSNVGTLLNKLNHCSTPFGKRYCFNFVVYINMNLYVIQHLKLLLTLLL